MLKRRRQTAVNQSRAGEKKGGKESQQYQPTPNDLKNLERIDKFLARAQTSKTTHPKLLTKLLEVYKEIPQADFSRAFRASLMSPLKTSGCNDAVNRIFLFVANFCAAINNNEEEGNLCPFNAHLFTHLLEGSGDSRICIRLRSCQLINALLQSLDADKGLETWLADAIQEAMLKRMQDKSPQVRVQAVSALQRLQDPDNPECPVITSFMESLRHDPCTEVRCRLLAVMARIKRTLPLLVERHADEKESVRKAALLVLSRLHMRSLKIAQRESVLARALNDLSPVVRNCAETELLPWWLLNNDGDYFRFLGCLDVFTTGHENVCKEALYVLFKKVEAEDLVAFANQVLADKLLPIKQLNEVRGPQMLVYWRCLVEFFRDNQLEDSLDSILPDLTPFAQYMQKVLLGAELPETEDQLDAWSFNASQLLLIATGFDLGDEMGRSELRRTLVALLYANKCNTLTGPLVETFEKVEPSVHARLIALAEIVSDLHNPLAPATQVVSEDDIRALTGEKNKLRFQVVSLTAEYDKAIGVKDFSAAKTLDEQLNEARERLSDINKRLAPPEEDPVATRREVNDVETLLRCLNIVNDMMQDPKVAHLTPELRTLMMDFVEPLFQQEDLSESLRLLCLRCFGCFCLLDKKVAQEKITIFFVPLAEEGDSTCAVVSLQTIFDLFFCYGVDAFGISGDIDEREAKREESPGGKPEVNMLDSMLFSLRDFDSMALVIVAATGFCKLLLGGHLSSYRVLIALVLAWFHKSEKYTELRLTLEDFFSTYTSNRSDALMLMVECVDPLVEELLNSEEHEDLDVSQVLLLVISLTRPGINPEYKENVHLEMAARMSNKIIADPAHNRAPYLAQALSRLQLVWADADTLKGLRAKAVEIEPLFAEDRLAKRFVNKFVANITAAEEVLARDRLGQSDTDGPDDSVEGEVVEGVQTPEVEEDDERMEIDSSGSSGSRLKELMNPLDVIAGSSSPVNIRQSLSRLVIPESDSESSE